GPRPAPPAVRGRRGRRRHGRVRSAQRFARKLRESAQRSVRGQAAAPRRRCVERRRRVGRRVGRLWGPRMSTVTVKRLPRAAGRGAVDGELELQEPPLMAEEAPLDFRSFAMIVPMGLGMGGMMMMFGLYQRSPIMYVMGGGMATAMLGMGLMQVGRAAAERKRKMRGERRDFLRYIAQLRKQARKPADHQRQHLLWNNPPPTCLWSLA